MKKYLLLLLSMLFLIVSCQNKESTENGQKVLKFAAYQGGYGDQVWPDIVKAYEELNPNVKVDFTQSKTIETELTAKIKGGDYPDVVMVAMGRKDGLPENFVKEQALEELTDILKMKVPGEDITVGDKIEPSFLNNLITNPYRNDKVYLMPMFYSTTGLFYNKTLFEELNLQVPETWEDFFKLGEQVKSKGIALFTYPTAGYLDTFLPSVIASVGGYDEVNKYFEFNSKFFETKAKDDFMNIIGKIMANVQDSTVSNGTNENLKKNQQLIIDGKALFMPNGSWVIDEMKETTPETMKWGMMALPRFNGGERYAFSFFEQIWVPKEAQNKDLAKDFIAFLYSDKAAEIFAKYNAVQPIKNYPYDKLSEQNQIFFNVYKEGAKPVVGGFVSTKPIEGLDIKKDIFFSLDSVVNKTKTIKDWENSLKEIFGKLEKNIIE